MHKLVFLFLGAAFGFFLSRAGATTYDFYAKLFLFEDMHLLQVILGAVAVGLIGFLILRRLKPNAILDQQPIVLKGKSYKRTLVPGSLIFGMGWGLAGACPGTVLAMLGEGKFGAIFTIIGIMTGVYFHGLQMSQDLSEK